MQARCCPPFLNRTLRGEGVTPVVPAAAITWFATAVLFRRAAFSLICCYPENPDETKRPLLFCRYTMQSLICNRISPIRLIPSFLKLRIQNNYLLLHLENDCVLITYNRYHAVASSLLNPKIYQSNRCTSSLTGAYCAYSTTAFRS